jgi:hypothetical protein
MVMDISYMVLGMAIHALSAATLAWMGVTTLSPGQQISAAMFYLLVAGLIRWCGRRWCITG